MNRVIDAHQHFWERGRFQDAWLDAPQHRAISSSFLPKDLEPLIRANGVDATVVVQTQHDLEENRWALGLADRHPWIAGVVGWVDLQSPRCEEQVVEFKAHRKFVGVRHIVQDEPDDDWVVRDAVVHGLKVLEKHEVAFDLLTYVKHAKHAATLAKALPTLRIVIDHLSKPDIRRKSMAGWKEPITAAAAFQNVHCKLSSMITQADAATWTAADLRPYVDVALEAFGPGRLMFGSDWPVCLLAGSYDRVKQALEACVGRLSAPEQEKIFGGTALKFYRLA